MKLLLFFSFCLIASVCFSQNTPGQPAILKNRNGIDMNKNDSLIKLMNKYLELTHKKSGVVDLQLDRMPCVIPNTKLLTPVPNAWKGGSPYKKRPAIPNPSRPSLPNPDAIGQVHMLDLLFKMRVNRLLGVA